MFNRNFFKLEASGSYVFCGIHLVHVKQPFFQFNSLGNLLQCFRPSEKSIEQKEISEQELLMKGPGTFPLERLLAIFQCITSVAEISLEDAQGNVAMDSQNEDSELMSDVLLQLSSLCNANFVVKGGSCPLEGSTRYRSTVSEDMALKVIYMCLCV